MLLLDVDYITINHMKIESEKDSEVLTKEQQKQEHLANVINSLKEQKELLDDQLMIVKKSLYSFQRDLDSKGKELDILDGKLIAKKHSFSDLVKEVDGKIDLLNEYKKAKIEYEEKFNSDLLSQKKASKEESDKLKKGISVIEKELNSLKDKKELIQTDIKLLSANVDKLQEEKSEIYDDIEGFEKTSIEMASDIEHYIAEKEKTEIDLSRVKKEKKEFDLLHKEKEVLKLEVAMITADFNKLLKAKEKELSNIDKINSDAQRIKSTLAKREEVLSAREKDLTLKAKTLQKHYDKHNIPIEVI